MGTKDDISAINDTFGRAVANQDAAAIVALFARQADGSLRFKYDAFNSDAPA